MNRYKSIFKEGITSADIHWDKIIRIVGKNNEAAAYVIYGTLEGIVNDKKKPQESFRDACENENLYGSREDIVKEREKIATLLNSKYDILVDPIMKGKI